jgi:tetratricopeptide (TPR) repeat protein
LNPSSPFNYYNLLGSYLHLSRLEEAQALAKEAEAKYSDYLMLHRRLYQLAFARNDRTRMSEQLAWATGKQVMEYTLLNEAADADSYSGKLIAVRQLAGRGLDSAGPGELNGFPSLLAGLAMREAFFGNMVEAQAQARAAIKLSKDRDVQARASLAVAMAGDSAKAKIMADELATRFPEDTVVQFVFLPTIHAQVAMSQNDASKAIDILRVASPYELGIPGRLHPVYVRGQAYLAGQKGREAAIEFQKIIDNRGVVFTQYSKYIIPLAHLGLARAYVLQGDTAKAKAAYQDFLTLWKDADPDVPILKEAKAEYARLQ